MPLTHTPFLPSNLSHLSSLYSQIVWWGSRSDLSSKALTNHEADLVFLSSTWKQPRSHLSSRRRLNSTHPLGDWWFRNSSSRGLYNTSVQQMLKKGARNMSNLNMSHKRTKKANRETCNYTRVQTHTHKHKIMDTCKQNATDFRQNHFLRLFGILQLYLLPTLPSMFVFGFKKPQKGIERQSI